MGQGLGDECAVTEAFLEWGLVQHGWTENRLSQLVGLGESESLCNCI
jgi:hypothetical protein